MQVGRLIILVASFGTLAGNGAGKMYPAWIDAPFGSKVIVVRHCYYSCSRIEGRSP